MILLHFNNQYKVPELSVIFVRKFGDFISMNGLFIFYRNILSISQFTKDFRLRPLLQYQKLWHLQGETLSAYTQKKSPVSVKKFFILLMSTLSKLCFIKLLFALFTSWTTPIFRQILEFHSVIFSRITNISAY